MNFLKRSISLFLIVLITFNQAPLVLAAVGDVEVSWYLSDHLGSVEKVLDADFEVVADRDYMPFGMTLETAQQEFPEVYGEVNESGVSANESYAYTGKELDVETDLYYYGARYYDQVAGRFTSIDPLVLDEALKSPENLMMILVDPQMLNAYAYVANNPMIFRDFWGESRVTEFGRGLGQSIDGLIKVGIGGTGILLSAVASPTVVSTISGVLSAGYSMYGVVEFSSGVTSMIGGRPVTTDSTALKTAASTAKMVTSFGTPTKSKPTKILKSSSNKDFFQKNLEKAAEFYERHFGDYQYNIYKKQEVPDIKSVESGDHDRIKLNSQDFKEAYEHEESIE